MYYPNQRAPEGLANKTLILEKTAPQQHLVLISQAYKSYQCSMQESALFNECACALWESDSSPTFVSSCSFISRPHLNPPPRVHCRTQGPRNARPL